MMTSAFQFSCSSHRMLQRAKLRLLLLEAARPCLTLSVCQAAFAESLPEPHHHGQPIS